MRIRTEKTTDLGKSVPLQCRFIQIESITFSLQEWRNYISLFYECVEDHKIRKVKGVLYDEILKKIYIKNLPGMVKKKAEMEPHRRP